jgi:hypothetical protein
VRAGPCIHSKNDGTSYYGTIVTVEESPVVPGVLWVGTDDGNIQLSRDGGSSWTEVGRNLPGGAKEYYVSRVEPSHADAATAYVSLDGHRSDDMAPYIFLTRDYGRTWTSIAGDLPKWGNVNTVRQDPRNPRLLFAGTEFGFFASYDEGASWKRFMSELPVVRIDDVLVHPRDGDLILATHGRSVWIMDDITPLQQLADSVTSAEAFLFEPRDAVLWKQDFRLRRSVTGAKNAAGDSAPEGTAITWYLKGTVSTPVKITITEPLSGEVFRTFDVPRTSGIHRVQWDLCSDRRPVRDIQQAFGGGGFGGGCGGGGGRGAAGTPMSAVRAAAGKYAVTLEVNGKTWRQDVTVVEDDWLPRR